MSRTIGVEMPAHLCRLAGIQHRVQLALDGPGDQPVTQRAILDALETQYPALQGTIRDYTTKLRRPFIRFFACEQDLSHLAPDDPLPNAVAQGIEPFLIVGAIAGGSGVPPAGESAEVPESMRSKIALARSVRHV